MPSSTWMLLSYSDEEAGEIRVELSLPRHIDGAGFVKSWTERIILRSAPFGSAPRVVIDDSGEDESTYDVSVVRKDRLG